MTEIYYIHGSKSSIDLDVFVVVPPLTRTTKECQDLCEHYERELNTEHNRDDSNVNLISIYTGQVTWCFKGRVDEVNNSLIDTYNLHEQRYDLLVSKRMLRDFEDKALRAVRVILSLLSRTDYRVKVKEALRGDILHRLNVLMRIDIGNITDLGVRKNVEFKDYLKVVAFQIGQVFGLLSNKELYTKEDIAEFIPPLKPFLFREEVDLTIIEYYKTSLMIALLERQWEKTYE